MNLSEVRNSLYKARRLIDALRLMSTNDALDDLDRMAFLLVADLAHEAVTDAEGELATPQAVGAAS